MPRWTFPAVLVLGLALVAGCGDDGDGTTSPDPAPEISGPEAEQWTVEALTSINQMAASVDEWAAADFSGLGGGSAKAAGEEPTWDEGEQAWVLTYDGPFLELEPPDSWTLSLDFWIQFRSGGSPVADPALADAYEVRMDTGMVMHSEEEGTISDLDYRVGATLLVTGLDGDTYGVTGSGGSQVDFSQSGPQGSHAASVAMGWEADLRVPADGSCPRGTARVTAPGFTLDAVYDGAGTVDWELTGQGYHGHGSETLDCGPAAKR